MNSLKARVKKRIQDFVAYRVAVEVARLREAEAEAEAEAARRAPVPNPVDEIAGDPLAYHNRAAAEALAVGLGLTYGADIEGDVAEFGTMTGFTAQALARGIMASEAALAQTMQLYGIQPRALHLFDSFEGLPRVAAEADTSAPHVVDGAWAPGTCQGLTEAQLRDLVTQVLPPGRVHTYPGWFSDTVPRCAPTMKLALIHVDADLYSSTIDVLDNLFRHGALSPGAIIFFDDWNCNRASQSHGERRAWKEVVATHQVEWSDRGGYGLFGHSVFVHNYASLRSP